MTRYQDWPAGYQTKLQTVVQGEFKVSSEPTIVLSTILGSCVSVCLFDEAARLGGMNHYLLAEGTGHDSNTLRYGTHAMELLINALLRKGATRHRLKAKVFGGAKMNGRFAHIGQANASFAQNFLQAEGIPIAGKDLGGKQARRVNFHPFTGLARCNLTDATISETSIPPTKAPAKSTKPLELF